MIQTILLNVTVQKLNFSKKCSTFAVYALFYFMYFFTSCTFLLYARIVAQNYILCTQLKLKQHKKQQFKDKKMKKYS